MAKLTIAEVNQNTTKGGKPYLSVKSSTGKWYYVWSDAQYIWHFIVVGATIEPIIATQGNFTAIMGIVGVADQSGGVTAYKSTAPSFNDWLTGKIKDIDEKLDWLVNERKTMGALPPLDDKGEITLENIPF